MTATYPRHSTAPRRTAPTRTAPSRTSPPRTAPLHRLTAPARRATHLGYAVLICAVMAGGMVLSLVVTTYAGQVSLESADLRAQVNDAVATRQRLESDVAASESPAHLLTVARTMGMVPAANPVFLRLSDHRIIGRKIAAGSNGS